MAAPVNHPYTSTLLHIMTLAATVIIAMVPTTTVLSAVTMVVPVVATTGMATMGVTTMVAMMVIMAATTEEPEHLVPLRNFAQGILLPLPSLFSTTTFCSPSVLVRLARRFLLRRATSAASVVCCDSQVFSALQICAGPGKVHGTGEAYC